MNLTLRRASVFTEAPLLGLTLLLSVLTGLGQGLAWPWVLILAGLSLCGVVLSRSISIWAKVALGVLLPCWWIVSRLTAVTSCGYGSYDENGRKGVEPKRCEVIDHGLPPLVANILLILIVAIFVVTVAGSIVRHLKKTPEHSIHP